MRRRAHRSGGRIRRAVPSPRRAAGTAPARTWDVLAVIGLGGGIGSVARHLAGAAIPAHPYGFPWATFLVNVTGCLAIGGLMAVVDALPGRRYLRPFTGVGLLGGYTTFSTYANELVTLVHHGAWAVAGGYALGSILAGLAAVRLGKDAAGAAIRRAAHRRRRGGAP
ncbi:FluC/FEX family fluoride channel [Thermobispora bispora]|jgi:fluoride exporter|uniref:Fluoride-specific ion channel FluC n=1 Tax=Thermobispora bispora (strain ATCC 19993 / DSM 43833 / CBS 139.67 / JCM 10125 / KCTC 9307 / NBRC 14880 / R51) TaxID=469371 RepID=D6Y471_THEBD|nr:CrcB family protein [Thermobispora bispora]MBO2475874.1 CrcB family protein [Actinomycetales bacterium]MDI9580064.1 CrcB family protein [Thermobispora sp.]ADG87125.1 CrcB protein [Thermobispora bispora DSM 43833]MBX6167541.1 CrcB family protein [Thermobispora bispora]QSI47093.1 CrcB family protein [Thermobispora bispora]